MLLPYWRQLQSPVLTWSASTTALDFFLASDTSRTRLVSSSMSYRCIVVCHHIGIEIERVVPRWQGMDRVVSEVSKAGQIHSQKVATADGRSRSYNMVWRTTNAARSNTSRTNFGEAFQTYTIFFL